MVSSSLDKNARGGFEPPPALPLSPLDRQHRDNPHVTRVDDNHLILIDEIEVAAPIGVDAHQGLWDRRYVDFATRNHSAHLDIEIDVIDPWGAARFNHRPANLGALLIVELNVHARGVALKAL